MKSDAFTKFLRAQIHITEDEIVLAKAQDVAAAKDGSGSRARHIVLRKRGALHAYRLVLRVYQDFKGVKR